MSRLKQIVTEIRVVYGFTWIVLGYRMIPADVKESFVIELLKELYKAEKEDKDD